MKKPKRIITPIEKKATTKAKNTIIRKYGVDNASKTEAFKTKIKVYWEEEEGKQERLDKIKSKKVSLKIRILKKTMGKK